MLDFALPAISAVGSDPPPAGPAGCMPGAGGISDGVVGKVLCGTWANELAAGISGWWPWLATLAVAAVAARVGWRVVIRRMWAGHARAAQWLEIIPPNSATPAATVQLWRLAATLLRVPRWWRLRPPRLVWEVAATDDDVRCGLWVPPGINPTAVARVVQRAWPGARVDHTTPPALPATGQVVAHRLVVTQPEWLPLLEDPPPAVPRRRTDTSSDEEDRLRAVYDGLAAAGRTGYGLLQVHLSRAPAGRVRLLRRATTNPRRAGRRSLATGMFAMVAALVRALLDMAAPGPPAHRGDRERTDPYTAQLSAQARVKLATGPHLIVAVYAAAAASSGDAAKAACADITSGYGILATHLARRRLWRPRSTVGQRWASLRRMTLVTVAEAAALASLPAEPAAYGLPQAAARRRPAGRDVWTPPGSRPAPVAGEVPAPCPDQMRRLP